MRNFRTFLPARRLKARNAKHRGSQENTTERTERTHFKVVVVDFANWCAPECLLLPDALRQVAVVVVAFFAVVFFPRPVLYGVFLMLAVSTGPFASSSVLAFPPLPVTNPCAPPTNRFAHFVLFSLFFRSCCCCCCRLTQHCWLLALSLSLSSFRSVILFRDSASRKPQRLMVPARRLRCGL